MFFELETGSMKVEAFANILINVNQLFVFTLDLYHL